MTTPAARPRARSAAPVRPAAGNRAVGATAPRQRSAAGPRTAVAPGAPGTRGGPPAGPVQPGSRRRMAFLTAMVVLALAVFGGRLVYVQGLRGAAIAEDARNSRLTSVTLLGSRGEITDASGMPLATSVERYDISVNQRLVAKFKGTANPPLPAGAAGVAATLAPLLDMNAAELGGLLVGDRSFVYIRKGVLPAVAREIRKLGLNGVNVDRVAERVYPNGTLAGNVVGFVNSNGIGLAGLEASLDDRLRGTPGSETYERGRKGQVIPGGYSEDDPARPGDSVQLTLLSDVQWKAQSALDAQVAATGSSSGSLIVMDTRTGEVYALADSGSVDPNKPGEASGSLSSAVSDVFEPGSTGKVITMAAILDNKIADPLTPWEVPYTYSPDGKETFKDSHEHGLLRLTTTGVLAESSNTGTVMIGQHLPVQTRYDYLQKFGFGSRTGIEMSGESKGILHPVDDWQRRDKYAVLFGQAVSVTALQATQVFATIANGGVRVQPHIVKGWTSPEGVYTPAPAAASTQVVSPETAETVLTMMQSVVDDGTGSHAAIPGYQVAGKTGTAQNWVGGVQGITASFIGVAPADDPRIAVAVILHNPKSSEFGGVVAAPVFSDVAGYTLSELGVAPSGTSGTLFPTTW
ncbi:penicillin-binding protein 2 [Cellulomonas sp. zg-ZUI188]|uniref:Penicillin-binding protein 2 n=2 Tax=Cellulomonas fengjieae TaxID=2819978 RepID=A0ABS3SEY9_9CELL|nr:penicillin-binding protein 2 [Cellulomonas fengjieae]MBO3084326.1 penicillin-binding protein 2 [Cellulomonas fengjieae]MBO3103098.1 penicillin-binding protein 2 [Cellulomonas fengjieae]QVI67325.1 penicillin-binding protein 2 [Cellulomonas fengjieae]